jgi:hypothetical protein
MKGATNDEIEMVYGLGPGTIKKWMDYYPGLRKAIAEGRTAADGDMLFALFKTGIGYHEYEEQAVGGKEPSVMRVQRYFPGQFLAQKHWLARRKKDEWPDKEQIELTGTGKDGAIKVESRNEVIDAIVALVASKPDLEKEKAKREQRAE